MAHANVEAYRDILNAFEGPPDPDELGKALAPDVRWHEAGNPEVIEGRDAVLQRMSGASGLDGDLDVHDVLGNDEHVIALLNVRLRKPDGSEVSYPAVEVAHMKDGQVTERWAFMDASPDDVTAFFADLGG